ncbi:MAG TPA: PspC domain-containing protein [Acidimicrobiales bacterium]|nr:PspC domain-containing protein [Acidimicrobiales bacterium]
MDEERIPDAPADDAAPDDAADDTVAADPLLAETTVTDEPGPRSTLPAAVLVTDGPSGGGPSGGGPSGGDASGGGPPDGDSTGDDPHDGGAGSEAGSPRRLRRDMEHRMLGGVAAGAARYLDIDVVFIRVAFAVLIFFGGSGALIYLAAWLLIPADDEEHPIAQQWARRRPPRRSLVVLVIGAVIGIVAVSDLFSSGPWWPHRDGGVGLVFGAVALVLALGLVAGSGGNRTARSRLRWMFMTLLLSVLAIVVVAAATVFSIEAASGVPLRGGMGDTQWHPTSVGQLASNYRLAVGNLNVDLSAVPFRSGTTHVTASVGVGRLIVEVPPGPTVSVVAHSGLGAVEVFGRSNGGLSTVQTMQSSGDRSRSHVVLDADAGVGQVQVVRTASALS